MAEVSLRNVSKKYGQVQALTGLNLDCADGEFLVLLGPSGAGKTSTLKMIAGLESVTSGEIAIAGRRVNELEPRQRHVAMVFENYALYPHLSVFENLASPLKASRLAAAEVERRVRTAAEMLHLLPFLDRKPAHLSGGQQQRVSFGRALVKEALAYLMDEPLSHLDAKLRHQMRGELKRIHADVKVTTIYVTHDFSEALALADRIVVLNRGVVQQVGTPDEIYDYPANECVADLVGEPPMNLLRGRLSEADGVLALAGEGFHLLVPEASREALAAQPRGRALKLGIRPTQVTASLTEQPGALRAEVYVLELLGGVAVLTVSLGGSLVRVRVKPEFRAELGETVFLTLDRDKLRFFDGETGLRLL